MDPSLKDRLIRTIMRLKRSNISFPPELEIRMGEFFLLSGIAGDPACEDNAARLSDIHHHLHVTKPAVSQMLNAAEKKGFILREIDKDDRRKISITLTPKGQTTLSKTKEYMDDVMEKTLSRFGEENAWHLIGLLSRLADAFEDVTRENGNS